LILLPISDISHATSAPAAGCQLTIVTGQIFLQIHSRHYMTQAQAYAAMKEEAYWLHPLEIISVL
jgi:alpha-mannosidase